MKESWGILQLIPGLMHMMSKSNQSSLREFLSYFVYSILYIQGVCLLMSNSMVNEFVA